MSRLNRNHCVSTCVSTCFSIIYLSVAVFQVTDGGSITWFEPPPFVTVTDPLVISAANKSLIKGSHKEELSCNFSLTADLRIVTVSMKFAGRAAATLVWDQQAPSVEPSFASRLNATWVLNKLTLTLLNVTDAEEGEYRCEVISSGVSAQTWIRAIQVSLVVPSSITTVAGKTVVEGDNVMLKCLAEGKPTPSITWTRLSDNRTVTMPLINISRDDVMDYRCTADNGVGAPATRNVTIDVQYPPEVNDRVQNATVAEGVEHTFSCPVGGNPVPNITWYSGTEIYHAKQFKTQQSGCYICVARNVHGISDNITQCLIINSPLTTVPPSTDSRETMLSSIAVSQRQEIEATVTIITNYEEAFEDLNSTSSKEFVAKFEQEMNQVYANVLEYIRTKVTQLRPGSVIVYFILYFKTAVTPEKGIENLRIAISFNGTFGDFQVKDLVLMSEERTKSTKTTGPSPSSTTAPKGPSPSSTTAPKAGPPWIIIIAVAGGVVLLAILVGVVTWKVRKQRKCRKNTKLHNSNLGRDDNERGYSQVQGAYAQSGPPAANGTDGAAGQEIEVAAAIPTYAVVDKSKKKKKLREEVPAVYAEVDKSKKKKKKVDDKNLYETLDEPKKARKPGELLYADLGHFQNQGMSPVSISPQPLPAIKIPEPYERTDYADITQFHKGNAKLPQNDGNEDTVMKPKRPSKKKVQGNDNETPI